MHTYARVDPPSCLQELWVKLCHICIIPLEQDPDSTAWVEIAVYYFYKMGFFLVHMISVCILTNSPFEKTLQKIINFNSYSAAKATQLGGKYHWALNSKTGVFKRIVRKKRLQVQHCFWGKMYICDKCIKSPKNYTHWNFIFRLICFPNHRQHSCVQSLNKYNHREMLRDLREIKAWSARL